jgi:hypothetical protein
MMISARVATAFLVVAAACWLSGPASAAAPANDAFASAEQLTGRQTATSGTSDQATKETGEPNHAGETGGASIWYVWTAPAAGRTTISTCGESSVDTVLAVYTGAAVNALTQVAANNNACGSQSRVTFQAAAGATYRIAVDGVGGATGDVELDLRLSPPNDDFADAVDVAGDTGSIGGLTTGASIEADEPEHVGDGHPSVWYSWTAPSNGWATFETCGASYDSVLAVYTGSQLAQLTEVASNDDACGLSSRVSFEAAAGTVYSVAVAGFEGATGDFTLVWNRNAPPPEPPHATALPMISGVPRDGETLSAADGVWVSSLPLTLARAWGRCDRDFERCELIPGAGSSTYGLSSSDVGWRFFVRVTATSAAGTTVEFSGITPPVAAAPPVNVTVPIVRGSARPGSILVATAGEWSGTGPLSLTYQWQACDAVEVVCSDLPGEAAPVLRVTAAHLGRRLRVVVTASNPGGLAGATSDATPTIRTARRCVVPNVRGKTMAAARRAIRRGGCATGRVRRAYSASVARGRVVAQAPRAGAGLRAGAKVSLVLSRGRKR